MRTRWLTLVAAAFLPAAFVTACAATPPTLESGERTIYMAAIEPKGTTNVADEPFPTDPLPPGDGYGLEEPNEDGDWTVETYRWLPSEIIVTQGDDVTLEIVGINGASHPSVIEGYDIEFDVKRGQATTVNFAADKAGVFRILCSTHAPAMTGHLVVLPSN